MTHVFNRIVGYDQSRVSFIQFQKRPTILHRYARFFYDLANECDLYYKGYFELQSCQLISSNDIKELLDCHYNHVETIASLRVRLHIHRAGTGVGVWLECVTTQLLFSCCNIK